MIHVDTNTGNIRLAGTGLTLLTDLVTIIDSLREEGFPLELIEIAANIPFKYADEIGEAKERDKEEGNKGIKTDELSETFTKLFGAYFRDQDSKRSEE
ncbi:MAG: hypothetical protein K6F00_08435 [Lachnospiraceae bacterium]|nr:hypothetical protein [Lachnospiraceae bacterium]